MHTKTKLRAAVTRKLQSTADLRSYKAMPWAPEAVHQRAHEIAEMRRERRRLREDIRYLQLAHAYVRGRAYRAQEPKVRQGNEPYLSAIHVYLPGVSVEALEAWYKDQAPAVPAAPVAA